MADYEDLIGRESDRTGVPANLLRAVVMQESSGNPNAVNSETGATGLAQLMPATAESLGVSDRTDPEQSVRAAADYLREGYDKTGNTRGALMHYYGGPNQSNWGSKTNAYPDQVLGRISPDDRKFAWGDKGDAPSSATFTPLDASPKSATFTPLAAPAPATPPPSAPPVTPASTAAQYDAMGNVAVPSQDAAPSPSDTSIAGEAVKGFGEYSNKLAKGLNTTLGALPVALDKIRTAATNEKLDPNQFQNWWFSHFVDPLVANEPAFQAPANASLPERLSHSFGNLTNMMATVIVTTPAMESVPAAQLADLTASKILGGSADTAARAAIMPGLSDAAEVMQRVYGTTRDAGKAAQAGAASYLTTAMMFMTPVGLEGGPVKRVVSGAASMPVTSEAGRVMMNLALPSDMQQPFEPSSLLENAITGGVMGGTLGHRSEAVAVGQPRTATFTPLESEAPAAPAPVPRAAQEAAWAPNVVATAPDLVSAAKSAAALSKETGDTHRARLINGQWSVVDMAAAEKSAAGPVENQPAPAAGGDAVAPAVGERVAASPETAAQEVARPEALPNAGAPEAAENVASQATNVADKATIDAAAREPAASSQPLKGAPLQGEDYAASGYHDLSKEERAQVDQVVAHMDALDWDPILKGEDRGTYPDNSRGSTDTAAAREPDGGSVAVRGARGEEALPVQAGEDARSQQHDIAVQRVSRAAAAVRDGDTKTASATIAELDRAQEEARRVGVPQERVLRAVEDARAPATVDVAAHDAAASHLNERPEPSKDQILAGNAALGHPKIDGMDVSIENPAGTVREDKHNTPPQWGTEMQAHYGYIRGTLGHDKDHLDVFVKTGTPENFDGTAYVVNQNHANGKFDEHKVILGPTSLKEARELYLDHYTPGWAPRIRSIVPMDMDEFKAWAFDKSKNGPSGGPARLKSEVPVTDLSKAESATTKASKRESLVTTAFARGDGDGIVRDGVTVDEARKTIDALTATWKNAPPIEVIHSMDDPIVPERVRKLNEAQLAQGASGRPAAFYDDGKVYVIAPESKSADEIIKYTMHEALGHHGLRGVFGDKLDGVLRQIVEARRAEVFAKAKEYGLDASKKHEALVAAEEVLAEMAQTRPEIGFVRNAIAAIRSWLRERGLNLRLSDAEIIRSFIEPARNFVEKGRLEGAPSAQPSFARRLYQGVRTTGDFILPETPEYEGNKTGDLAVISKDAAVGTHVEALPIRLPVGVVRGGHKGFGLIHMKAEADLMSKRKPRTHTEDPAENFARDVADIAQHGTRLYYDAARDRVVLQGKSGYGLVLEARHGRDGTRFYSVVTMFKPDDPNFWGRPVRTGRADFPITESPQSVAPEPSPGQKVAEAKPSIAEVQTEPFEFAPNDGGNQGGAAFARKMGDAAMEHGGETEKVQGRSTPGRLLNAAKDVASKIIEDLQLKIAPMAAGSERARAVAKDYANAERLARWQWSRFDERLKHEFTPAESRAMWEAADEENVLRQLGEDTKGRGLDRLDEKQRKAVETLHQYANDLLAEAKDVGLYKGEGLPYWTPRMVADISADGEFASPREAGGASSSPYASPTGRNITTSAGSLRHREYLTAAETEAAAKAKFGDQAQLVRDIRTMPLAMARLERAIAGRQLINEIRKIGEETGQELVSQSDKPGYFTVDSPAFKTYRPRFVEEDGKHVAVKDAAENVVMDKVPLYVSKEFEGPLKAIMSDKPGIVYQALMQLKAKATGLIMYSPLIHNAVEWGRALPLMPGKVFTLKVYFEGNRAKNDPETMRQLIDAGMVPIGSRFGRQDISGILEEPNIAPGRSLTAKALAAPVGLVSKAGADAVKRAVDKAGDIWHNKLLWDRVADLQAGLAVNMRDSLVKSGMDEKTALKVAAHLANRYAGALPNEAMSAMARKAANMMLFSRTFTLGNLGVMKDMVSGLPRDVQAQILRDGGEVARYAAVSSARKVAIHAFALDVVLMYAMNSALQSGLDYLKRDKTRDQITQGYVDRARRVMGKVKDDPSELLKPFNLLGQLSATSTNEPGKENRVRYGTDKKGTAIYLRSPLGKIGEEFSGWATSPLDMLRKKEGTISRPAIQTLTNDKGFGRQVYDPDEPGFKGAAKRVGNIVWNFMSQQAPSDSIEAAVDLMRGKGDELSALKVAGPLMGLTFSKGAPGGPAVGELLTAERHHHDEIQRVMPAVQKLLKDGDVEEARTKMRDEAHMSPAEIRLVVKRDDRPDARLTANRVKRFNRIADDDAKERMQQFREERSTSPAAQPQQDQNP